METGNQKLRCSYEEGQMDELHKLAGWHPNVWTPNEKLEKPPLDQPLLRGRISSDVNDMDELHRIHGWTPDRTMIRPSPETIQRKADYLECVRNEYNSHEDYILQQVFGKAPIKNQEGRYEIPNKESMQKMKRFERNQFSYDLPGMNSQNRFSLIKK